ncbi:hypothetical protein L8R98_05990 [Vibrio splendidus]|uniref:hypothetical protein n=1 Tax=Vibrio splendidus TaxID=29497 RepID=UPI002468630B|nr:hypothetical protein [Vibrio splendidus]MDH5976322.1 hypothetical protein [Vibrio splendidus]
MIIDNKLILETMGAKLTINRTNDSLVFISIGEGITVQAEQTCNVKLTHIGADDLNPVAFILRAGESIYHVERNALLEIAKYLKLNIREEL